VPPSTASTLRLLAVLALVAVVIVLVASLLANAASTAPWDAAACRDDRAVQIVYPVEPSLP
jgi:hypothetical protein